MNVGPTVKELSKLKTGNISLIFKMLLTNFMSFTTVNYSTHPLMFLQLLLKKVATFREHICSEAEEQH